jgi:signal transduction histidine kinase
MVDKSRKREQGGNGLGLAITKKIIDLHKGSIRIESELNKGASFIVAILK